MIKQIFFSTFMILINLGSLSGQSDTASKIYYDFEIDYPPTFENAIEIPIFNWNFDNSTSLEEVFTEYFTELLNIKTKLAKKSGKTTFSSAIPPDSFKSTKLKITFDTTGYVSVVDFYGKTIFDETERLIIQNALQKSKFLPAMKDGRPVKLVLYYYISVDSLD